MGRNEDEAPLPKLINDELDKLSARQALMMSGALRTVSYGGWNKVSSDIKEIILDDLVNGLKPIVELMIQQDPPQDDP